MTATSTSSEIFLDQSGLVRISANRKEDEDARIMLTVIDSSSPKDTQNACVSLTLEELCVLREKIEMVIQHG